MTDETRHSPAETVAHDVSHTAAIIGDIAAERVRQVNKEGWTIEHDDEHEHGEMADAAAYYAATTRAFKAEEFAGAGYRPYTVYSDLWPKSWADHWFKPDKARRRQLVIAAALLVAEIERLDRAEHDQLPREWEGDPLHDACQKARAALQPPRGQS